MVWLFENPIPGLVFGAAAVALSAMALVQSGRLLFLWMTLVALFSTITYGAVEYFVVTPAEVVEARVYQLAEDLLANDTDRVLSHISERSPSLRRLVERHLSNYTIREAKVKPNLTVEAYVDQGIAKATFNGVIVVDSPRHDLRNYRHARKFLLSYRYENNQWMLADYEEFSPVRGDQ